MVADGGRATGDELGAGTAPVGDVTLGDLWGPLDGTRATCGAVGCDVGRVGVCIGTETGTALPPLAGAALFPVWLACSGLLEAD